MRLCSTSAPARECWRLRRRWRPVCAGIDFDDDAITSARENLDLNPGASNVTFQTIDVRDAPVEPADVVLANLTGGSIVQSAAMLRAAVAPGGSLS